MAAYAAHLTRMRGGAPSVFQLAAQEALADTVKPALRRLVEYLSSVYPGGCGWLQCWFDELYLLMDLCLQYHYLKHYASSFSESFYGLNRTPLRASEWGGARLPVSTERWSLISLAVVPYLADKVTALVDGWREDEEEGRLGKNPVARLRSAAIRVHSTVHTVCSLARLVQLLRYMTKRSQSHSPALGLLGLSLTDAPPGEEHKWGDAVKSLMKGHLGLALSFPLLSSSLLAGAQWTAFAVQCLRSVAVHGTSPSDSLPPPPPPPAQDYSGKYRNKCPLCLHSWRIPTVLPVSGTVFCYVCISRHVRTHRSCPVTRCPVTEDQLVRMYVD